MRGCVVASNADSPHRFESGCQEAIKSVPLDLLKKHDISSTRNEVVEDARCAHVPRQRTLVSLGVQEPRRSHVHVAVMGRRVHRQPSMNDGHKVRINVHTTIVVTDVVHTFRTCLAIKRCGWALRRMHVR
jgi:hypothetical protein